jgi:flagellar hook assembly protein FlgD
MEIDETIIIDPEIFSPDNDGYNDLVSIKYKFNQPGFMMSVDIYNSNGFPVRKLINNEYLGTEGSVNWDGIKDDNTKAAVGIYIIYIQVFDLDGNVKQFKETVVLAGKL